MRKYLHGIIMICFAMVIATSIVGCTSESASSGSVGSANNEQSQAMENAPVSAEPVTLKIWTHADDQPVTELMCNNFKAAHPEYDLTFEWGQLGADLTVPQLKVDADAAADVLIIPSGAIPELVEAGLLLPITVDKAEIESIHAEGAIKGCTFEDLLYAVPVTPNSFFMYYDKSKYTEEEVLSLETMLAKDLGPDIKNFSHQISNSWFLGGFFYANGCTLFGPDGDDPTECSWNTPQGIQVGEYLIDLAHNPKYVEDRDGIAGTMMREGKLAALCSGIWAADSMKEILGDNLGATKLPTIKIGGVEKQLSNFADFKCYAVKSATKYPKAAQLLAAWLCNEESQLMRFEERSEAPTIKSLTDNPSVAANVPVAGLSLQIRYSTPNPTSSKLNDYWAPAEALGTGIYEGSVTKENLQEKLDACVEAILAKLTS